MSSPAPSTPSTPSPVGRIIFESALECWTRGLFEPACDLLERLETRGEDDPRSLVLHAMCLGGAGRRAEAQERLDLFAGFLANAAGLDFVERDRMNEWLDAGRRWLEALESKDER